MESFGYPICKDEYAQYLKEKVTQKPGFVVSTTYCPYCNKAKSLLDKYGVAHDELVLDELNPKE